MQLASWERQRAQKEQQRQRAALEKIEPVERKAKQEAKPRKAEEPEKTQQQEVRALRQGTFTSTGLRLNGDWTNFWNVLTLKPQRPKCIRSYSGPQISRKIPGPFGRLAVAQLKHGKQCSLLTMVDPPLNKSYN